MHGYLVPLRCPRCGGMLAHVVASKVRGVGSDCSAVAGCEDCRREFAVFVQLREMERRWSAA